MADVERLLIQKHSHFDTINYIYVVDRSNILLGVLTIKNVFRLPKLTRVKEIMITEVVSVRATVDQEKVALLALRHNLKAIPVVDKDDHLLGAVPSDTIFSILHQEAHEDLLLRAGVRRFDHDSVDPLTATTLTHVKKRLPWLLIGLFGGALGAVIVSRFQEALATELLLAAFIPPLVYLTDAVGTQSEMLFVHSASHREKFSLAAYLKKEVQASAILAFVLGVLLSAVAYFWFHSLTVAITVGVALLLSVIFASIIAVCLPWVLLKLKRDPAVASGPFVTIFSDLLTITIYFFIAEAVLKFFA
jgi:magnesium transporter